MNTEPLHLSALRGKCVVVLGGSSGIGLAVAREAARLEARVVIASRSAEKLEAVRKTIEGDVTGIATDMLSEQALAKLFSTTGTLDHLVVTAIADENQLRSPIRSMSTETAQRGMEKFWGSFFAVREALPHIAEKGSITLTSSISILKPSAKGGASVMSAASGAVAVLGRSLAAELAPIRVNVVAPGVVETGVWRNLDEAEQAKQAEWARSVLPARRYGQPEDIAQAILFFMTNPYTTGSLLNVDGGLPLL